MRGAKTKQTTDCEQNKQTKQSSGQLTAKNPEENKQTKQFKHMPQHSSKSIHRQIWDQGADLGPSQIHYLLCLGKCQTRVNRQLFRSLRKNLIGTLMRQSKLLVSGFWKCSDVIVYSDNQTLWKKFLISLKEYHFWNKFWKLERISKYILCNYAKKYERWKQWLKDFKYLFLRFILVSDLNRWQNLFIIIYFYPHLYWFFYFYILSFLHIYNLAQST